MAKQRLSKRYRLMLRWGLPCVIAVVCLGYLAYRTSIRSDPSAPAADGSIGGLTSVLDRDVSSDMVRFSFADVSQKSGIDFQHFPAERQSLLPEDMGSGLTWGDYDDDGDTDLFLVNFQGSITAPEFTATSTTDTRRRALYRNEGDGQFVDVSQAAGLAISLFGMAAAWGDYDSDGDLDLYLTAYGPNHLFRNDGNGTFTDVTETAGVGDDRFSAGCAWGDFDRDGRIDLYVCTYVTFKVREQDIDKVKQLQGEVNPYTINPSSYPADTNVLYHNNGDGTFTDVAKEVGVSDPQGRSLGAVWFDFDNDQWIDLYVANDVSGNAVLRNTGDGKFADVGAQSLAADYRGAMGLAVCDYEDDGDFDLFVTHWVAQENAFFVNMASDISRMDSTKGKRPVFFADRSDAVGLGQVSLNAVGWGTGFVDFDNDSYVDLYVVNGNTLQEIGNAKQLVRQRPYLFRQQPPKGFYEVGEQACARLGEAIVGRGGASADYDNDGKMDLAIMAYGDQPILLHNTTPESGHWLGVRLRQESGNTFALGACVKVGVGDRVQMMQVGAEGSYLSQSPTDLHFGLGEAERADSIEIRWPDGTVESHQNVDADEVVEYRR